MEPATNNSIDNLNLTGKLEGFSLNEHTFAFPNEFTDSKLQIKLLNGKMSIPVGNAKYGLCGGMAVAAAYYYTHKLPVPQHITLPPSDTNYPQLFEYIKDCQVKSLTPKALLNYVRFMANSKGSDIKQIRKELPEIIDDINQGKPCLLGLIRAKASLNPSSWTDIVKNHQVLVYAYTQIGDEVCLKVFDSKEPSNEDVFISCNRDGTNLHCSEPLNPIYTFFKVDIDFSKLPQPPLIA